MYEGDESLVLEMATYHDSLTQFSTRHNLRRTEIMVEKVRSRHLSVAALNSPRKTLVSTFLLNDLPRDLSSNLMLRRFAPL
jgi:hypothetical protein